MTLTKATLTSELPKYIRDVLRNSIASFSNRVYKSALADDKVTLPSCILDVEDSGFRRIVLDGTKYRTFPITMTIEVWAKTPEERDTLTDSVITTLKNQSSTDGTTTLANNALKLDSISATVDDQYMTLLNQIVRVNIITATFKYHGT